MLSILIPTYNRECTALVCALVGQANQTGHAYEIIVADDASTDASAIANQQINRLPHCRFEVMPCNKGRASIRNWLAMEAKGEVLLFMDSDAQVTNPDFLLRYLDAIRQAPVVCGGLRHPDALPHPDVTLRYTYEKEADLHRAASERGKHPYACFATFCFAIRREVFMDIQFDENCKEYGYEDTLFGEELKRRDIPIFHFDNPLIHTGLEDNLTFLRKTETALCTLVHLQQRGIHFHSRLVDKHQQLRRWALHGMLPPLFRLFAPLLRRNLLGKSPNLTLFALYKLGYYACLLQRNKG